MDYEKKKGANYDPDELSRIFDKRISASLYRRQGWLERIRLMGDAYAGDPLPEEAREQMTKEGRPFANFNHALGTINAVLGGDMDDRKEARFEGVDGDFVDDFLGEALTKVVRHTYVKGSVHRQESMAYLDLLVTGYGWMNAYVDVGRVPLFIKGEYVDATEMHFDPNAKQNNLADARWVCRERRVPLTDAIAMWPEKEEELEGVSSRMSSEGRGIEPRATRDERVSSGGGDTDPFLDEDYVHVFDYQYKVKEAWYWYRDPITETRREIRAGEWQAKLKELQSRTNPMDGSPLVRRIEAVRYTRDCVYRCLRAGTPGASTIELEEPKRIEEDMFTYRCATGFRRRERLQGRWAWFGLMDVIYEPQLWASKALSSGIEFIARGVKDAIGINAEFIEDPKDFVANSTKPGYRFLLKPGFNKDQHLVELARPSFPQGYETIFRIAMEAVPSTSNVTDYTKGTARQERSNVLVSNLQSHAEAVLNPIADPLTQLRTEMAQLVGKMCIRYMAPEDFNKIVGDMQLEGLTHDQAVDPNTQQPMTDPMTGEPVLQPKTIVDTDDDGNPITDEATGEPIERPVTIHDLLKDRELFDFHVEVDLGQASPTAKHAVWALFSDHDLLGKFAEDQDTKGLVIPFMFRNLPGFPASSAKQFAEKLEKKYQQMEMQGTVQGIMQGAQNLPPDQLVQVAQAVGQMAQAAVAQMGGGGEGGPGGQPPPGNGQPS